MEYKGHCIICHRDNVELSDEHVIPEAIGGYYHIYNVCKDCNSKLGDHVDNHLLNHWLIKASRHEHKLKGYSNTVPNPLIGDGELPTGEKVRVEEDEDGKLYIHLLPSSPIASSDGHQFSIAVDAKDEKLIPKIQKKVYEKNNIDPKKCQIVTKKEIHQIERPEVHMQFAIDLNSYKFGLLKIAYEFAVDKVSGYYDDPIAKLYSEILYHGDVSRLSEAFLEGDAIVNANIRVFESMIDYSNRSRHILLLINLNGKLYCLVKLFDKFSQMIRLSDKAYGDEGFVMMAINDFSNHKCTFMNAEELIKATMQDEITTFELCEEGKELLKAEIDKAEVGFACNKYGDNLMYDPWGNVVCTESQLLLTLERIGMTKDEENTSTEMKTTYVIPYGYHYLLMPSQKLTMVRTITKRNVFKKI